MQPTWWRKQEEVMLPWTRKKKVWTQSLVTDKDKDKDSNKKYEEEVDEAEEAEDGDGDAGHGHGQEACSCGEPCTNRADARHPGGNPEVGSEEEFEEEEVVEATEEREALKGQSKEEVEVDRSV
ncbi:hypothetical protein PAXRUDRAFT_12110 [Paxillus rubicundulus Ve08.2h10]|uniref:Uncharacterized protein n=1 Tax=Paxillus rubicundulus Ve08.2h10 TaxID=930991 RepID=A0A0D0DB12_9AGAM|nr:hypothetical protein PAXRUDRAFT_12110 [Paxillus rubicundulus Ve08.2h10]